MTIEIKGRVSMEAADAVAGLGKVDRALDAVDQSAADAARGMATSSRGLAGVGEAADGVASSSSQAAGGLGDLGGALSLLPGPLGALGTGMELAAPAIMGVTGAADLLNLVTTKFPRLGGAAAKAAQGLAAAKRGLGIATRFALGPWGLLIIGLTAMGALLVTLWNKSDTFKRVVTGAFNAIASVGRWMWNTILQPVFRLLILAIAGIMSGWAAMLRGLSKVPGFGWAATAADKMGGAANKARAIANNMQAIKDQGEVKVKVNTADLERAKRLSDGIVANLATILENNGLGVLAGLGGSGRAVAQDTTSTPTTTVNITVQGALDPVASARQIQQLLARQNVRVGVI